MPKRTDISKLMILGSLLMVISTGLDGQDEQMPSALFTIGPVTTLECSSIKLVPSEVIPDVRKLPVRLEAIKMSFKHPHVSAIEITTPLVKEFHIDAEGKFHLVGVKPGQYLLRVKLGRQDALGTVKLSEAALSSTCVLDLDIWREKDFVAIGRRRN